jgi:SAM-dependent methyltransferase
MYLGFAKASSGPVLDAACGTGRVLSALAQAGHSVTGVDVSQEMLKLAASRVERDHLEGRVRLGRADLRDMELGESYGMALVALSSFQHLLTGEDQREALQRLADHLTSGGLLVIDLVNPSPEWLAAGDGAMVHQLTAPFPEGGGPDLLSKFVVRTTHFELQRERMLLIYDRSSPDGALTRHTFQMETRFLFRYEAELLLATAGFHLKEIYGGYDLEDYQASSPRMILVAEKR